MIETVLAQLVAWLPWLVAVLFAVLGLACVLLVPVGIPGTWVLLALALLVELADAAWLAGAAPVTFGWTALGVAAGLGLAGEVVEGAAGVAGTRLGGGSRRGMLGSLLGGITGAILFTLLVPIPLFGTLLGAIVGTFVGAWLGEISAEHQRHPSEHLRAAASAAVGRLAGTLGKTMIAVVIWVLLTRAALPG